MGYFSNGTEGEIYRDNVCENCAHDGSGGCPVWNIHLLVNYEQFENEKLAVILGMLIPRDGIYNRRCNLFVDKKGCGI